MEQNERQEKKYCARLGWSLVLTLVTALLWQYAVAGLTWTGLLPIGPTAYYLLVLVGYYIAALPLARRLCRCIPVSPPAGRGMTPRLLGRWFVIGAALAKDMFNISVKKIIGSYIAEMGGVDAIIFTAGVGENDRSVRWDVCEHMEYLGIKIDPEKNKYRGKQMDIAIDWARVRVLVIPTNEELMIAKDTERLVNEAKK